MTGSVTFTDAAELWEEVAIIEASTPEAEPLQLGADSNTGPFYFLENLDLCR
jgi:hypothetical protein